MGTSWISSPTEILKVRMQVSPVRKSLLWHSKDLYYNHGGIMGFYKGLNAMVGFATILNATKMGSYDSIKYKIIGLNLLKDGP